MDEGITVELSVLREYIKAAVRDVLSDHGVTPEKYPRAMNVQETAKAVGLKPGTIHKNFAEMGLELLYGGGRGSKLVFSGLSVKRYVDEKKAEKKGRY